MKFVANHLYHIYNQGNNRQQIFFNRGNYLYFLRKVNTHLLPVCHIFSWCLMPNHFHFLVGTSTVSIEKVKVGGNEIPRLSNAFRILESSYARGINQEQGRTGSLFRQKTKAKCLTEECFDYDDSQQTFAPDFQNLYPLVCFHYIHQNALKAGLVTNIEDWEFSSLRDYLGLRQGRLCNYELCRRWISIKKEDLDIQHPVSIDNEQINKIF